MKKKKNRVEAVKNGFYSKKICPTVAKQNANIINFTK